MRRLPRIGVIGGSNPTMEALKIAYETGKLIAQKGAILVCGGLGGVMEAASKGAKDANGTTIGILPGGDLNSANPYIDIPVATNIGYLRNAMVVLNSHSIVAIDGSYGTLSEISYALIYGKKVFGLYTWEIPEVVKCKNPEEAVNLALKEALNVINRKP